MMTLSASLFSVIAIQAAAGAFAGAAAACPQALAIYADRDKTVSLEFQPDNGESATVTGRFRIVANSVVFDSFVQTAREFDRPYATITDNCPEGDSTGEEIEACTVWQGTLFSVGADGSIGFLPKADEAAAETLLIPDLPFALSEAKSWLSTGIPHPPFEAFSLAGCQE